GPTAGYGAGISSRLAGGWSSVRSGTPAWTWLTVATPIALQGSGWRRPTYRCRGDEHRCTPPTRRGALSVQGWSEEAALAVRFLRPGYRPTEHLGHDPVPPAQRVADAVLTALVLPDTLGQGRLAPRGIRPGQR